MMEDLLYCGSNKPVEEDWTSKIDTIIRGGHNPNPNNVEITVEVGVSRVATPITYLPYLDYTDGDPRAFNQFKFEDGSIRGIWWRLFQLDDKSMWQRMNGNKINFTIDLTDSGASLESIGLQSKGAMPQEVVDRLLAKHPNIYKAYIEPLQHKYEVAIMKLRIKIKRELLYLRQLGLKDGIISIEHQYNEEHNIGEVIQRHEVTEPLRSQTPYEVMRRNQGEI